MKGNGHLMAAIFQKGAAIKENIRIWSGRKKLNPRDLGLDEDEVNEELISLGSKWLIPSEYIKNLEKIRGKARSAIESMSMAFPGLGALVPNEKIDDVRAKLDSLKAQFDEQVEEIGNNYEQLRRDMMTAWHSEAIKIASRRGDPELVFEVMKRIEDSFKPWGDLQHRFSFNYNEYRQINQIAEAFIHENTKDIVSKFAEFATRLKERIEDTGLSEKNLGPVRKYIQEIQESIQVFENEQLQEIADDMESWTLEGTGKNIEDSKVLKKQMIDGLDKIIEAGETQVDVIAKASVDALTRFGRKVDLS